MKVTRRSGEHKESSWLPEEICVCTHAMLLNAIKMKDIDMSQLSLVVLDEAHEANSALSQYGLLLPHIAKCAPHQRPRVLAMTASPTGSNSTDMRQAITSLCEKLLSLPYTPLSTMKRMGMKLKTRIASTSPSTRRHLKSNLRLSYSNHLSVSHTQVFCFQLE